MLLPFQGAGMAAGVFPRVSLRLPWALCRLGFQPALWCGGCGIGAWVRVLDVRIFQGVASLALGYVLVGLSARLVVRGLRDWGMGAGIGCAKKNPPRPCCLPGGEDCRVVVPVWGRRAYLPIIFSVRVVPSASVTRTSTACGAERDAALYSAVCAPPTRSVPPTCLPSAV